MALLKTSHAIGQTPTVTTDDNDVVNVRMEYILAAAIASGDVIYFGDLPAGCVVIDFALENDDLDTGATLAGDLGILNAGKTAVSSAADDGGKWLTGSTSLQAAAFTLKTAQSAAVQTAIARMRKAAADRPVGFVATAAGAGGVGNKIALHLTYRAA